MTGGEGGEGEGGGWDAFKTRTHTSKSGGKNAGPPIQNLGPFRELAELNLKVSPCIELETVIGVSNSCHLAMVCIEK